MNKSEDKILKLILQDILTDIEKIYFDSSISVISNKNIIGLTHCTS